MTSGSLMKVESFAECSPWSILQYFWPALSDNGFWKPILVFILSVLLRVKTGFTVVLFAAGEIWKMMKGSYPILDR